MESGADEPLTFRSHKSEAENSGAIELADTPQNSILRYGFTANPQPISMAEQ